MRDAYRQTYSLDRPVRLPLWLLRIWCWL